MSEQKASSQAPTGPSLTRRSFLKWSAVLAGTAAVAGGGLEVGLKKVDAAAPAQAPAQGKWQPVACWHNCGGRCANYAYVVDGVVVKQKTDDTHPDSPDFPQQRGCGRGRSQRRQVFGADRIKYPMKRKNWAPGGGKKELRGRDEWVRISWDEALDILASETKRIKEKYGNQAILCPGGSPALALYGGYVSNWGSTSTGTWAATGPRIGVDSGGAFNDRLDLRNSKLIVLFGANPIWSSGGNPTYHYLQAKKAGAKFIFVDPYYNDSVMVLADEWIPIRPGTDSAMMLGMAYVMLAEDSPTNPLIDWDFLNRCTIGFDKDHLPKGADPEDNFKDYVLGLDASGKPAPKGHKNYPAKTPEWASEICGAPAAKIHSFAIEVASTKPANFLASWAPARINDAQHYPMIMTALGCMMGNIGKPGAGFGCSAHSSAANAGPALVSGGSTGVPAVENPLAKTRVNNNEIWDAVLTGKYTDGTKKDINIQMIYHAGSATLQTRTGMTKGIQAHRKAEFVVSHAQILTTNARYSDLVLPVTTDWERWGSILSGNREILIWASQVTEPLFEAKDDAWIHEQLGVKLGLDAKKINPLSVKQQTFNRLAGAKVMKQDGSGTETLVTITDQDIRTLGVEGKPQTGRIPIMEFKDKGIYQVPRTPGDKLGYIAFKAFREDPVKNKLATASGLIELHCQALADYIAGLGWSKIRPIPVYDRPTEGYEDTFADWDKKIKGEFPLQLHNTHYPRRAHSVFDNVVQLRRVYPHEFMMNPIDAEPRGIKQGDVVLITGKHGKCIRPVYLTDRIMPGTVDLPHGAWVEMDEETGVDKAGADNILSGAIATMEGHMGWNSTIVEVSKWTGRPLLPDYQWPQRIPVKENK